VAPGQRFLIVDDLLATGGTAAAAGRLVERLGGIVEGFGFLVELGSLNGRRMLGAAPVFSLINYA
jgi:adenine phosphoribosyltransferase